MLKPSKNRLHDFANDPPTLLAPTKAALPRDSKDKEGGGKRIRNLPNSSFTVTFDPRGASKLTASRAWRASCFFWGRLGRFVFFPQIFFKKLI